MSSPPPATPAARRCRYRGQFVKLLRCIYDDFLPALASCQDPDVEGPATLLKLYCMKRRYMDEPEGWAMPRIDESSYTRAE